MRILAALFRIDFAIDFYVFEILSFWNTKNEFFWGNHYIHMIDNQKLYDLGTGVVPHPLKGAQLKPYEPFENILFQIIN